MKELSALAKFIKTRRMELNNMRQEDLADRLRHFGVDRRPSTIANWETDRNEPDASIVPALAKALETSPFKIYDLLGIIDNIHAAEIVRALNTAPTDKIERIEKYIEMVLKNEL